MHLSRVGPVVPPTNVLASICSVNRVVMARHNWHHTLPQTRTDVHSVFQSSNAGCNSFLCFRSTNQQARWAVQLSSSVMESFGCRRELCHGEPGDKFASIVARGFLNNPVNTYLTLRSQEGSERSSHKTCD